MHLLHSSKTRLLIGAALLILLITYLPFAFSPAEASGSLELPMHSVNEADYRSDLFGNLIPAIDVSIVRDVLRDLSPKDPNIDLRVTAVYVGLLTPVPTSTPQYGETLSGPVPSATATATASAAPTQTATPTVTASPTQTASPTPSATRFPTNTPVTFWYPATNTPVPTATQIPTSTQFPSPTPSTTPQGNLAPVISGPASQTVAADSLYTFLPTASDPDGDALIFSIVNKPAWATFNPTSGSLAGTPGNTHAGTTQVTITVSDGALSASFSFSLTVTYTNHPPVITGPASQTVAADQLYTFTPAASDPDGDTLTFSAAITPAWITLNSTTGQLSGTPGNAHAGNSLITITVSDGALSASLSFTLTVTYTNHAPVISGPAEQTVEADSAYSFTPTASDPDGDPLSFSASPLPPWLSMDAATGVLRGTPSNADVGVQVITLSVSDGALTASYAFELAVTYTNHAPVIAGARTQVVAADSAYHFTPAASDIDGDALTFRITNQPSWAAFDPTTGTLSGTPSNADTGVLIVVIDVSDGLVSASLTFSLEVLYTNHAPLISVPGDQFAAADDPYSFTPVASDPDGDALTFRITNQPAWTTFDPATGTLSGTPTNAHVGDTRISITVSDGTLDASGSFTLTVTYTNHAPVITGPAAHSVAADDLFSFTPAASDPDGDSLTFSITNQPAWAAFDPVTGMLSGTPVNADVGTSRVTIHVSDGSLAADLAFDLSVTYTNHAPTISGPVEQTVAADSLFSYTPVASDPDGDPITFSVSGLPSWLLFSSATGHLSGIPSNADVGTIAIHVTVSDGVLSASFSLSLTVTYTNHAPTISGPAADSVPADSSFVYTPVASDPDGDMLTFSISGAPGWLVFDAATGSLSGMPTNANVGASSMTITVTDGDLSASHTLTLTVTYTNHAPSISGSISQTVAADQLYTFTPDASDPDGDTLAFSITNQPAWATFDTATGTLSGTPANADVGLSAVVITVSDGLLSASFSFTVEVLYTNHAPVINALGDQSVAADDLFSVTPSASDPDGDVLTFSIINQPAWAAFDPATGELSGTPTNAHTGDTLITITVTDGALSASRSFTLTVTYTNHAPVITGPAEQTVAADSAYSFTPAVSDPDGDPLTFSITNQPAWAAFDPVTGMLSGTPANAHAGTSRVTIHVSDGLLATDLAFDLIVTYTNHAPSISGPAEQSVAADSAYSFVPTASDPDGDPLTFSALTLPPWLSLDPDTGALSGTPTNTDAAVQVITLTVSDGELTASYSFALTVTYTNHAPLISGALSQVVAADSAFHFTPTASDADSDLLTFSITNQPTWAVFDPATGSLSGTPDNGDVGTVAITITVSDGSLDASLTFSLTVTYTNHAPSIAGPASLTAPAGAPFTFTPSSADIDGDSLTFHVSGQPAWMILNPATGTLSGMPTNLHVGAASITLWVSDGLLTSSYTFDLTVTYTNQAPVIMGAANQSAAAYQPFTFTPTASDPDGDSLTFNADNLPAWLSFDPSDGSLTGTPANADAGTRVITITVSDGDLEADLVITLTVTYTNRAPLISGPASQTTVAESLYSFTPTASDPDADALSFTVFNKPTWADFNIATGTLSGRPANEDVGTTTVTIRVSDGERFADLTFTLTVTRANRPPAISGPLNQSVAANTPYLFRPTASDPDGDPLTFLAVVKPGWASFDENDGTLSGTPTTANLGPTSVIIRVTDGSLSADLEFVLTVTYTPDAPMCTPGVQSGRFTATPSGDSYLRLRDADRDHGSENRLKVRVDNTGDDTKHALIKFDLSTLQPGTLVNKAYLYLTFRHRTPWQTTTVYRLTTDWDESSVTWNAARSGVPWNSMGGDYAPGGYASFPTGTECVMRLDITHLVQGWIDGDFPNYGIILISSGVDGEITFTSKDESRVEEWPTLVIDY